MSAANNAACFSRQAASGDGDHTSAQLCGRLARRPWSTCLLAQLARWPGVHACFPAGQASAHAGREPRARARPARGKAPTGVQRRIVLSREQVTRPVSELLTPRTSCSRVCSRRKRRQCLFQKKKTPMSKKRGNAGTMPQATCSCPRSSARNFQGPMAAIARPVPAGAVKRPSGLSAVETAWIEVSKKPIVTSTREPKDVRRHRERQEKRREGEEEAYESMPAGLEVLETRRACGAELCPLLPCASTESQREVDSVSIVNIKLGMSLTRP